MTVSYLVVDGHAYFADTCDTAGHQVGDRHYDVGNHDLEWTGATWAPVCAVDDVPMLDRDREGWLRCGVCLLRAPDAPVRTQEPARS